MADIVITIAINDPDPVSPRCFGFRLQRIPLFPQLFPHFLPIPLHITLPLVTFPKLSRAVKWFFDRGEIVDLILPEGVADVVNLCLDDRVEPVHLWSAVYATTRSTFFYAGPAVVGYLFFTVTINTYQQTLRASSAFTKRTSQFSTAKISVIGVGAAFSLFFYNHQALVAANEASRTYRNTSIRTLPNAVDGLNFEEKSNQLAKVKKPVFEKRSHLDIAHLWNKAVDQVFGAVIESVSSRGW